MVLHTARQIEPFVLPAIEWLSHYRLQRRLSFRQLATLATATGLQIGARTFKQIFDDWDARDAGLPSSFKPRDTTKYQLVQLYRHLLDQEKRRLAASERRKKSAARPLARASG